MTKQSILIVDDEVKIRQILSAYLEAAAYLVHSAGNATEAYAIFAQTPPDLVILDLMLPDTNGEEICRTLRSQSTVPILMLTAKVQEQSILQGFHLGADDYVCKPFSPRQIVARVGALLKRTKQTISATNQLPLATSLCSSDGQIVIDRSQGRVRRAGQAIDLTATELKMLSLFLENPGRLFSRNELVERIMGDDFFGDPRTIDAHIKNLRHKIEVDSHQPQYITTVYRLGYRLETL